MDYKVKNQNGRKPNSKVHRHIYISTSFPHERLSKLPEPSRGEGQLCKFLIPRNASKSESASKNVITQLYYPVVDPGEGPGGAGPPPYFSTKLRPEGPPTFFFLRLPPLFSGSRWPPPISPPPPLLTWRSGSATATVPQFAQKTLRRDKPFKNALNTNLE